MADLIAIPEVSGHRAAHVLATLRRLEEEYRLHPHGPGTRLTGPVAQSGDGTSSAPWRPRVAGAWAVSGSVAGAATAVLGATSAWGAARQAGTVLAGLAGGLLGAAIGALSWRWIAVRGRPRTGAEPTATWLVSYVPWDGTTAQPLGTECSILQVALPPEAEARLKAIHARAAPHSDADA